MGMRFIITTIMHILYNYYNYCSSNRFLFIYIVLSVYDNDDVKQVGIHSFTVLKINI